MAKINSHWHSLVQRVSAYHFNRDKIKPSFILKYSWRSNLIFVGLLFIWPHQAKTANVFIAFFSL
jgi:hypothetical protein